MDQASFAALAPSPAEAFAALNASRRAIRHFAPRAVSDEQLRALVAEAQLAPSSRNSQPYRFVCVRTPALRSEIAAICKDQSAARTAAALVVVIAGRSLARETLDAYETHLANADESEAARRHHQAQAKKARLFLSIGAWPIWAPLMALIGLFGPAAALLPLSPDGVRHWAARSAVYAIQTFLLAARAHGLDACPMEGFDAVKLARALELPRDLVIPAVIALGHAAPDARIEPRWRKPLDAACVLL